MLRKVLLVVGLIGASFAGGAAVNGPGQTLLRDYLLRDADVHDDAANQAARLPMAGAGAAAEAIEAAAATRAEADSAARAAERAGPETAPTPGDDPDPFPSAPWPRLGDEPERSSEAPPLEAPRESRAAASESAAVPAPVAPRAEASADAGTPRLEPIPTAPTEEADRVDPAPAAINTSRPDEALGDSSLAKVGSDPDPGSSTDAEPLNPPAPPAPGNWRARLAAAGVTRYWIEGEPNGPVRLRGVVPLAGETAVGQQFEAEADDEARAAELVLRRITLWQATREQ